MAGALSPSELFKYDFRLDRFLEKYKAGEKFLLVSGSWVTLVYDPIIYTKLKRKDRIFAATVTFTDAKSGPVSKKYRLTQFKMTDEFGGGRAPVVRAFESDEVNDINKQLSKIMDDNGTSSVTVEFKNKLYEITHATAVSGSKADIALVNRQGTELVWIAYERGAAPRDLKDGWAPMSGFSDHPEIVAFADKVRELTTLNDGALWVGAVFARKLVDIDVSHRAVFGMSYNQTGIYGRNSVNFVLQGRIRFLKHGRLYKLAANKRIDSGDRFKGEHSSYEPTMIAVHGGSNQPQFGTKNAEFQIAPLGGRVVGQWV